MSQVKVLKRFIEFPWKSKFVCKKVIDTSVLRNSTKTRVSISNGQIFYFQPNFRIQLTNMLHKYHVFFQLVERTKIEKRTSKEK